MDLDPQGLATRRAVLGDAYVDAARAKVTPFTAPLQELVTRHAWVIPGSGRGWTCARAASPRRPCWWRWGARSS
ncbi:hypothetical protein [Roseateles sp. BYS96W]|uniref:Uncharacterized protein n=1 Tax=Pelomonas nitida TaxID=3299027 RepID=A0ABW7GAG5_9BURK